MAKHHLTSHPPGEYKICCSGLPLAVYREIAAHLRQIRGIDVELLPQPAQTFDYGDSQVGGLWIRYTESPDQVDYHQLEEILGYYGERHGAWQQILT